MLHVIAYDIGTTGVKTGLISVGETVELVADAYQGYDLYILENGGAEQDVYKRQVRGMLMTTCITCLFAFVNSGVAVVIFL